MNNRIRIARTDNLQNITDPNSLNTVLAEGQPFYDKASQMLFIGDGATNISQLKANPDKSIIANKAVNFAFDLHITSQEQFDEMIASPNWLGAESVLLDGKNNELLEFGFKITSTLSIPTKVNYIKGINNGGIYISGINNSTWINHGGIDRLTPLIIDNVIITSNTITNQSPAINLPPVGVYQIGSYILNSFLDVSGGGSFGSLSNIVECSGMINCDIVPTALSSTDIDVDFNLINCRVNQKNISNATNAVNAINSNNAIVNSDGTYSGFTRNSNNVIQDGQNLLMTLKPIYINKRGFEINASKVTVSSPAIIPIQYQLDKSKVYYLCGTFRGDVGFGMVSLICDTAIDYWRTPIFWTDANTSAYFMMRTNPSTGQINITCTRTGSGNVILELFGIYELQIPVRRSTN